MLEANQDRVPAVCFLTGTTASGKGRTGLLLAERLGAEIISLDSMKVYRGMDILTAKPPVAARARVRHHLIDILDPWEPFSLGEYVRRAADAVNEVLARGEVPLFVGGTALYLKGLIEGVFRGPGADTELRRKLREKAAKLGPSKLHEELQKVDPQAAARVHPHDLKRVIRALEVHHQVKRPITELQEEYRGRGLPHPTRVMGIRRAQEDLYRRIDARVDEMFEAGIVGEVEALLEGEYPPGKEASQALGFKEIVGFLRGNYELAEAKELLKRNTRKFARKQLTWFKRMDYIDWLDVAPDEPYEQVASRLVARL